MLLVLASASVTSLLLAHGGNGAAATSAPIASRSRIASTAPRMGLFDGLAAAFANDDTLGERQEAGLAEKVKLQQITWVGPKPEGAEALFKQQVIKEQQAMPGASLKDLADQAGIPVRYSCMQGTCRICDVRVNGLETPACTAKMGREDVTIEFRDIADAQSYATEALKAERAAKKAAKAAGAAPPAPAAPAAPAPAPVQGKVEPTNPFGGFAMPNPFAQKEEPPPLTQQEGESNLEMLRRLRREEQEKKEQGR